MRGLPASPAVLDLGCGVGGQTLHLAELTSGTIVAVDRHAPNVARLQQTAAAHGLQHRIRAIVGDMSCLDLRPGSFDLVWSEGHRRHSEYYAYDFFVARRPAARGQVTSA